MQSRMYRFLFIALALLTAPAVIVPSASSGEEVSWSPEAEVAYRVALDYWGVSAPTMCGTVEKLMVSGPPPEPFEHTSLSGGSEPKAPQPECLLILTAGVPFSKMCTAAIHSVGHLMGQPNTEDRNSVMYSPVEIEVELCWVEAARLSGFGLIARRRIEGANQRCRRLVENTADRKQIARCRHREKATRRHLQKFLHDPYIGY